ncbi:DUF4431 domain-containing protein [Testudinibacter sp. P80/BLE/0925]|uniref:DUF4431 domain-containing protein n=1 Tax=Testudinibacter sp. TW-1 TaxID=3417757 RepID=UPI003D35FE9F
MKKITVVFATLLCGFSVFSLADNPTQVNYSTPLTLQGNIKKENGYPMLHLAAPGINLRGGEESFYPNIDGVRKLQIVWSGKKLPVGCVFAEGTLFGAETAHHKTDVLIELKTYKPCP